MILLTHVCVHLCKIIFFVLHIYKFSFLFITFLKIPVNKLMSLHPNIIVSLNPMIGVIIYL